MSSYVTLLSVDMVTFPVGVSIILLAYLCVTFIPRSVMYQYEDASLQETNEERTLIYIVILLTLWNMYLLRLSYFKLYSVMRVIDYLKNKCDESFINGMNQQLSYKLKQLVKLSKEPMLELYARHYDYLEKALADQRRTFKNGALFSLMFADGRYFGIN